jgi:hypothetical protein
MHTQRTHFQALNMEERGLYATFAWDEKALSEYWSYFPSHNPVKVMKVISALENDGAIRAKPGTAPVRYERITQPKEPKVERQADLMRACLDAYQEVKDPAWVTHHSVTRTLERALKSFITQVGEDAPNVMRRGLENQRRAWAAGKKLDLVNLLTNDKVIRFAEQSQHTNQEGMVYRLSVGKPDPRLPDSRSYAMRVDARDQNRVTGFVFPEGRPSEGVTLELPVIALSTSLRPWAEYQAEHA